MGRRFLTALLLAMWLLAIVQPAFACAPRTDCCPNGSTSGCGGDPTQAAISAGLQSCCATQAGTPYPVSVRARSEQLQPPAFGPQVTADFFVLDSRYGLRPTSTLPSRVNTDTLFDESLTYLRTARLRL